MPTKGEDTRARVLAQAAEVFNVRGYAGTSLSDIMQATGLKKGGVYNHFANKEELALLSFDHAAAVLDRRFSPVWERGGLDALYGFIETFRGYAERPPLAGGCPVLNTAIESDDTHPALRQRTREVVDDWRRHIGQAVAMAQAQGAIRDDVDADDLAVFLISGLEGALMLSKLYGDDAHLKRVADALIEHLGHHVASPPR